MMWNPERQTWNPESTDMEFGIHSVESGIQDSLGLPYMGRRKLADKIFCGRSWTAATLFHQKRFKTNASNLKKKSQ